MILDDSDGAYYRSLTREANGHPKLCCTSPITQSEASGYWLGLLNFCHLLDRRDLVDTRRVNKDGSEVTRQQVRAAARNGEQEFKEIVLRPGVKRRDVLHALSYSRIELLRAHPRRHVVEEHPHRCHTKKGIITRCVASYERGGRIGDTKQTYDARKLREPNDEGDS
jgi:hypothetical protein